MRLGRRARSSRVANKEGILTSSMVPDNEICAKGDPGGQEEERRRDSMLFDEEYALNDVLGIDVEVGKEGSTLLSARFKDGIVLNISWLSAYLTAGVA